VRFVVAAALLLVLVVLSLIDWLARTA